MIRFANQTGSAQEWAADVLDGQFVARVGVSVQDGRQLVRLRRSEGGDVRGVIGEWTAPKGRPWGQDDIYDMVVDALEKALAKADRPAVTGMSFPSAQIESQGEMKSHPVRTLRCACCDESVRGRQWRNRDTGYGVCLRCADANTAQYGEGSPEETRQNPCASTTHALYGLRGYHFGIEEPNR